MKKKIILITIIALFFLLTTTTYAFNMTIDENNITLHPGESYKVNLTFQSNETITITNIERNDTINDIQSYFSKTSFELNGTEKVEVLLVVSNTLSPGNYTLKFKATDNNSNENITSLNITIPQQTTHTNTGFHFGSGDILLGGETQERDTTITGTIEVYNDQNVTITNFNVNNDVNSRYQFIFTSTIPTTINPYEKFNITYTAYIPKETDSIRTRIGIVSYTSDQIAGSINVYVQAKSYLEISDIDFYSDDGDDSNLYDGDRINVDLKPGSDAKFEIDLTNLFSDVEDIDINDAYVKITIENIDDGDDIIEDSNEKDIRADDKETYTVEFTIPENAEEDSYTVLIEAYGEDDNGAEHYDKKELELTVERESHDLRIKNVNINPAVACVGDSVSISATLKNEGTRDEDRATIQIEVKDLNYEDYETFSLESYDNDYNEKTTTFTINTKNAKPGEYKIVLKAYYDDNLIDYYETKLYLEDCKKTEEKTTQEEKPIAIIVEQKPTNDIITTNEKTNNNVKEKNQENKTENKETAGLTLPWLIALNIIVIIAIIIVIIVLLK